MDRTTNYSIQELLGQGSFGKVYRAMKWDTAQVVAVKKISKSAHNTKQLEDFRHELKIHRRLDHPNIIKMIDYYDSERKVLRLKLVIIMECAKCSLADLIRPRLSNERIQKIACEITSALYYLHTERILHRDLKPHNVLVGYDDVTKLCDFGFAKDMALDAFLLTSFKGSPLYMAPELIGGNPYDHKTDLWSFGCILYELLIGSPPYKASHIYELHTMIKRPIQWNPSVTGDCFSFVKGLLETDSGERMDWGEIVQHPYVSNGLVYQKDDIGEFALTKALSPSQEFAKESQRKKYQAMMDNLRQLRAGKRMFLQSKFPTQTKGFPRHPNLILGQNGRTNQANQNVVDEQIQVNGIVGPSHAKADLNLHSPNHVHNGTDHENDSGKHLNSSDESLDTLTSSSDEESEDEKATVVSESGLPRQSGGVSSHPGPLDPWISGTRLAHYVPGKDDPQEIQEEWLDYINKNIKEVLRNPEALCEKYSFRLIVQPLRNQYTGVVVVEKIASLLSLPFALEARKESTLIRNLENVYLESKVVANLIYASKLRVIRRRQELGQLVECEQIPNILTDEDIDAIGKCVKLVCFLIHSEQRFVVQFCDCILGFQAYVLFKLFLRLDERSSHITSDALSILCHLMRTLPENFSILEDILLDSTNGDELWRLAGHNDAVIQACSLRVIGYLVVHSEKVRDIFVKRNLSKLWGILRVARIKSETRLVSAAEFVSETLRHLESPTSPRPLQVQYSLPDKFT